MCTWVECVCPSLRPNISETTGDKRLVTIGSLWETAQAESIGDVSDDVTRPNDAMAVILTAVVSRGRAHSMLTNQRTCITTGHINTCSQQFLQQYFHHCVLLPRPTCSNSKGTITSKMKHAIKHKTSPTRLAQLLQPSLAFYFYSPAWCRPTQPCTLRRSTCSPLLVLPLFTD